MRYRFDDVGLDTEMFELRVGGERVPVEPHVFEVLAFLVEQRGRWSREPRSSTPSG